MEQFFPDDTLLARWLSGTLTAGERQQIEAHPDFPFLQHIVSSANGMALPDPQLQAAWDNLAPALRPEKTQRPKASPPHLLWWALAGTGLFVLILLAWLLWPSGTKLPAIVATATGEQKTAILPDGSSVRLNAVSSLEVFQAEWADIRRLRLIGEAFFDVKKSAVPFRIETAGGTVSVLGTTFTVRYRGSSFEVACYTGLVLATDGNGLKQTLREGQRAISRNGHWDILPNITDSWPAWMQGQSQFFEAPYYEVFAELQRQYHIHIDAKDTAGKRFSGSFPYGDLANALDAVCAPLGLQYAREGEVVRIWK